MPPSVADLLAQSGLPGPRGNLTLLAEFVSCATPGAVEECLVYLNDQLSNCPEEFVAMCGIVGSFHLHRDDLAWSLATHRPQAGHRSWRIREAVVLGIQDVAEGRLGEVLDLLEPWERGSPLEKRAVVAAVCEPRLLGVEAEVARVLEVLSRITGDFRALEAKLSDDQSSLRQTLGYGWSVAVAASPEVGRPAFETLAALPGRHIAWIVQENLKKHRMKTAGAAWVESLR